MIGADARGWYVDGMLTVSADRRQVLLTQLLQTTLEVTGEQEEGRMAWQRIGNHDVFGQRGHQDGLPRGKIKAHCEQYGRSRSSRTATSSLVMAGLGGQATFEHVHGSRQFARCIRQQSAEAPRLWLTMAMKIL